MYSCQVRQQREPYTHSRSSKLRCPRAIKSSQNEVTSLFSSCGSGGIPGDPSVLPIFRYPIIDSARQCLALSRKHPCWSCSILWLAIRGYQLIRQMPLYGLHRSVQRFLLLKVSVKLWYIVSPPSNLRCFCRVVSMRSKRQHGSSHERRGAAADHQAEHKNKRGRGGTFMVRLRQPLTVYACRLLMPGICLWLNGHRLP